MNLEIKKQFRKESKAHIFIWGEDNSLAYTEAYVNWLEKKLNTSNAKDNKDLLIDLLDTLEKGGDNRFVSKEWIVENYLKTH